MYAVLHVLKYTRQIDIPVSHIQKHIKQYCEIIVTESLFEILNNIQHKIYNVQPSR